MSDERERGNHIQVVNVRQALVCRQTRQAEASQAAVGHQPEVDFSIAGMKECAESSPPRLERV
jgi:hypothetical protein